MKTKITFSFHIFQDLVRKNKFEKGWMTDFLIYFERNSPGYFQGLRRLLAHLCILYAAIAFPFLGCRYIINTTL